MELKKYTGTLNYLKTNKMKLTKQQIGLIIEHMYFNLLNVTEDWTENMVEYEEDIKLYKKLRDYASK